MQASKRQPEKKLLQLLQKYESLFEGTLGNRKTKLVSFQLRERVSPYHGQAFPGPISIKTPSSKRWRDWANWGY